MSGHDQLDFIKKIRLSLYFKWAFGVFKQSTVNAYGTNPPFLRKTATIDTSRLLISSSPRLKQ
jgi:hypothetical protein